MAEASRARRREAVVAYRGSIDSGVMMTLVARPVGLRERTNRSCMIFSLHQALHITYIVLVSDERYSSVCVSVLHAYVLSYTAASFLAANGLSRWVLSFVHHVYACSTVPASPWLINSIFFSTHRLLAYPAPKPFKQDDK